ncbi:uncharacterized protein LOC128547169 [Mercenaria mercenaria]|uniref:uncharacterized protein LOC128547169 n=1 Tax=Mercenaria mercenaria TaxID=6596 RepID=UPI00234FB418|nr:uncharacterized protein LOC128547169 [Mercenaria mercenaria]
MTRQCSIYLKHDAKPVVHPPRRIPVALRDKCKKELDKMEKLGVITKGEHDANLRAVLQRSLEQGIRLNPDKLEVGQSQISYFGHVISKQGLSPDPDKVSAIREMPIPENRSQLETVLGMSQYLARYAPRLSEVTLPLRELLAKDVEFLWGESQQQAYDQIY